MRVRTKLATGFAIMAALAIVCGVAGWHGIGSLSAALAYVTGPAWDAADGAMEASIGIEAQMLAVDRLTQAQGVDEGARARLATGLEFAASALARMRSCGLFERAELERLDRTVAAYEQGRVGLMGAHERFVAAHAALAATLHRSQTIMIAAEELGDGQVEQLERQPDQQHSWNGGLRAKWDAADGAMEAQISLLERAYYYQRVLAESGAAQEQEARAGLERSLARLREKWALCAGLPVFERPVSDGEETYAAFFRRAAADQERLLATALAAFDVLRRERAVYRSHADQLLELLRSLEEVGDSKVEGHVATLEASRRSALTTLLGAVVLGLLVAVGVTVLLARDVVNRLERLDAVARRAAGGELVQQVAADGTDEVGQLSASLGTLLGSLRDYTRGAGDVSRTVGSVSSEIDASVQAQSTALTSQASAVAQATSSLEELRENALKNDERAREVLGTAKATGQSMTRVQEQVQEIAASIVALSGRVQQVGEILDSVSDIADQSNLLALNASIEASKAGEFGRGFDVVAGEVRSLAQQSQRATLSIRTILRDVQKAMSAAVMRTEEGTKRVAAQSTELDAATRSVEQIVYATREQTRAIEQIADAVSAVAGGINQSQASSAQIAQATRGLVSQAEALRTTLEKFAA